MALGMTAPLDPKKFRLIEPAKPDGILRVREYRYKAKTEAEIEAQNVMADCHGSISLLRRAVRLWIETENIDVIAECLNGIPRQRAVAIIASRLFQTLVQGCLETDELSIRGKFSHLLDKAFENLADCLDSDNESVRLRSATVIVNLAIKKIPQTKKELGEPEPQDVTEALNKAKIELEEMKGWVEGGAERPEEVKVIEERKDV